MKKKALRGMIIIIILILGGVIGLYWQYHRRTENALKYMQQSPFYKKFHTISHSTANKFSEIFLERGNDGWGGYEAMLFIQTHDKVRLYSYLPYPGGFEFNETAIAQEDFINFLDTLTDKGIWKLYSRDYHPFVDPMIDDGSTYFLRVTQGKKEKKIVVYSPEFIEAAKGHLEIIQYIEKFCYMYTKTENTIKTP